MSDRDRPTTPEDPWQRAYAALEELIRRINLHRSTGEFNLRISAKQGGPAAIRIGGEEIFNN